MKNVNIHFSRNLCNKMDGKRSRLIPKLRGHWKMSKFNRKIVCAVTQWLHIKLSIISKEAILGGEMQELQCDSLWPFLGVERRNWQEVTSKRNEYCCNPNVHWMPHKEHPSLHSWQRATRETPKSTMFSPPKNRSCVLLFWPCPQRRWGGLVKKTSKGPPFPQFVFLWTEITSSSLEKSPHPPTHTV